jgi:DNA relaxase NicK
VQNILDEWKDTGRWWDGEDEKVFYRLTGTGGAVYELCSDGRLNQWNLYRVLD